MESEHSDKLAEVIGEWQTRLLQLDRRNNLLYFKPKLSAIRIIDTSPDKISEDLITSRGGLSFDYAEPRTRGARDVDTDEDQEEKAEPYVIPGDIRAEIDPLDLQRRLRNLRRKDKETTTAFPTPQTSALAHRQGNS